MRKVTFVVKLLTPCGNSWVPYKWVEFSDFRAAEAYRQNLTARGVECSRPEAVGDEG